MNTTYYVTEQNRKRGDKTKDQYTIGGDIYDDDDEDEDEDEDLIVRNIN